MRSFLFQVHDRKLCECEDQDDARTAQQNRLLLQLACRSARSASLRVCEPFLLLSVSLHVLLVYAASLSMLAPIWVTHSNYFRKLSFFKHPTTFCIGTCTCRQVSLASIKDCSLGEGIQSPSNGTSSNALYMSCRARAFLNPSSLVLISVFPSCTCIPSELPVLSQLLV